MLHYTNAGVRSYYDNPVPCFVRNLWEIQCQSGGSMIPTLYDRDLSSVHTGDNPELWLFPPDMAHGWRGKAGAPCRRVVFHFNVIPELLENYVYKKKYIHLPLSNEEFMNLENWYKEIKKDYFHPSILSPLRYKELLYRISLVILENIPSSELGAYDDHSHKLVDSAIGWFQANLQEGLRVNEIARTMRISQVHLRRLFYSATGKSPKAIFRRIQIERSIEYLKMTSMNMTEIAMACGFSCSSAFSRSFSKEYGESPLKWRKKVQAQQAVKATL